MSVEEKNLEQNQGEESVNENQNDTNATENMNEEQNSPETPDKTNEQNPSADDKSPAQQMSMEDISAAAKPEDKAETAPEPQKEADAASQETAQTDKGEEGSKDKTEPAGDEKAGLQDQEKLDEAFEELKKIKEAGEPLKVFVKSRIRSGLRVTYKDLPIFLPASHFGIKRTPSEEQLQEVVGKELDVYIHEIQEDESGRRAVIVSRKKIAEDKFWDSINEGDIVKGPVSSIASFGVFVDLGGIEGLIHISRLSQVHVDDPKKFVKKGEMIEAKVVDVDREKKRIALSKKALEKSPWKNVEEEFPVGTKVKGIVRRIADFGAYIELKPGVDGLLRTSEISWTERIKTPASVFKKNQEIEAEVINVSEDKEIVGLSYKRTQPNPWPELKNRLPQGTETSGKVKQVMSQGAIVSIEDSIDGFMPRSKMRPIMRGKNIPFKPGDEIDVVIADLVPEKESLILAPKVDEGAMGRGGEQRGGKKFASASSTENSTSFALGDMLSEEQRKELINKMNN